MFSVTEKEIFEGLFKPKQPNKSALCFIRHLDGLEDCLSDSAASRFIDVKLDENKKPCVDDEAMSLLNHLKENNIPSRLDKSNIFHLRARWGVNGILKGELNQYLERFGKLFYENIIRLVEEAMDEQKSSERLEDEVLRGIGAYSVGDGEHLRSDHVAHEFKSLMTELSSHATAYNQIIGKFFGRDYLTEPVELIFAS